MPFELRHSIDQHTETELEMLDRLPFLLLCSRVAAQAMKKVNSSGMTTLTKSTVQDESLPKLSTNWLPGSPRDFGPRDKPGSLAIGQCEPKRTK